jgi:hypothetical protein
VAWFGGAADRVSARSERRERVSEWANGRRKKQREEGILWMPVQWPWCVVSARLIITGLLCHLMLEISWIQNKSMESRSRRGRRRAEQHSRLGAFLLGRAAHCRRAHQRNLFGTFAPRRSAHCDPLRFCRHLCSSGLEALVGALARGHHYIAPRIGLPAMLSLCSKTIHCYYESENVWFA